MTTYYYSIARRERYLKPGSRSTKAEASYQVTLTEEQKDVLVIEALRARARNTSMVSNKLVATQEEVLADLTRFFNKHLKAI